MFKSGVVTDIFLSVQSKFKNKIKTHTNTLSEIFEDEQIKHRFDIFLILYLTLLYK